MGDSMLLNTRDAAAFLGVTENTLRQSRVAGKQKLRGVTPPAFVKTGHRSVMYRVSELVRWKAQFEAGELGKQDGSEEPEEPEPVPKLSTRSLAWLPRIEALEEDEYANQMTLF